MAYEFGVADQFSLIDPCGLQTLWLPMSMPVQMSMETVEGERCETQTTCAPAAGEVHPFQVLVQPETASGPFSHVSAVNLVTAEESTFAGPESRSHFDEGATLWGADGATDHLLFYDEDDATGAEMEPPCPTLATQSCGFFFQSAGPVPRQNPTTGAIFLYEFTPHANEGYPDKLPCPAPWVQTGVWQRRELDWPPATFPLEGDCSPGPADPRECGADPTSVKVERVTSPAPEDPPPPRPLFPAWVKDEVVPDEGYGTPEGPPSEPVAPRRGRKCKQARCSCRACVHPELVPAGAAKCHSCDYEGCSKTYKKTSHLRAHVLLHQGLRPFKCTFGGCSKSFTRSDELSRHTRTHTKARTHPCHLCHKAFTRSDHRAKHIKSHERRERLCQIKAEADANPTTDELCGQPPLTLSNFYPNEMMHV